MLKWSGLVWSDSHAVDTKLHTVYRRFLSMRNRMDMQKGSVHVHTCTSVCMYMYVLQGTLLVPASTYRCDLGVGSWELRVGNLQATGGE